VPPRENFPDLDELNASAPREEWSTNLNGVLVGPFVRILVLKLLDAVTMDRFAFVTKSIGGSIAVGDITDKIKIMRRLRGGNVTAVVSCRSVTMKSSYNPRGVPRPDFKVLRWIALAAAPETVAASTPPKTIAPAATAAEAPPTVPEAAAAPTTVAAPVAAAPMAAPPTAPETVAPTVAVDAATIGTVVVPPTLKEEIGDEVPF
jgi:hypothetical protein